jgi:hypothetical protein
MNSLTLPGHVQRMLREYTELDERLVMKIESLTSRHFADLEPVAQGLLAEQKSAMQHYHQVLKNRLDLEGIDMSQVRSYDQIDYMLEAESGIVAQHLGEPVEVGGHDIDHDGPPSFTS